MYNKISPTNVTTFTNSMNEMTYFGFFDIFMFLTDRQVVNGTQASVFSWDVVVFHIPENKFFSYYLVHEGSILGDQNKQP